MRSLAAFLLASLCALPVPRVDAFVVSSEPVRGMDPTHPHRLLEQRYFVGSALFESPLVSRETLQTLKIGVPGRVFVSYNYDLGSPAQTSWTNIDWTTHAATVRFSGNSEDVFEYFEVASSDYGTIEVRRRANAKNSLKEAYMLVEISLAQSHSLTQIINTGTAEIIVEDQVFASDPKSAIKVQLHSSGDVYINSGSTERAGSLEVDASGSGDVHWLMGDLQTQKLSLNLAGSGDFTLVGQRLESSAVDVAIAGSGDVCIDAAASLQANSLYTSTLGSGTISVASPTAHCTHEDITILGSGDVFLGSVQASDVKVTIAGSGDVYVQAVHSITGSAFGAGDVKYIGTAPQLISDRRDSSVFSSAQNRKYKPIAKPKAKNKFEKCRLATFPPREAVLVNTRLLVNPAISLGPLIFLALLSCCYLRSQRRPSRRARHYPHPEMQPLMPMMPPPQQQEQQQQNQVWV